MSLRAVSAVVLALALALPVLLAAPAAATYPHVSDPFAYQVNTRGYSMDVDTSGFVLEMPAVPEVCVHRTLFCIGPIQPRPITVGNPGQSWAWLMVNASHANVTYNESRSGETGPWLIETPLADIPICSHRCFVPMWANVTIHSGYMVTYYDRDHGTLVNLMEDVDVNSTAALYPLVREYEVYGRGEPRRIPDDWPGLP